MLLCLLCAGLMVYGADASISLHYAVINNFPVKFVLIDMNDPGVVVAPAVARGFPTGLDSWGNFLSRLQPDAAINGTYFCPRGFQPVGDIAIEGALIYRGAVGTALCITPENRVLMLPGPRQGDTDWHGYRMVICAGPRLLTNGRVTVNARAEGFRDAKVLGSANRSAVAVRGDNTLIFLTIERNISLENLAYVCQKLGAVQAMTLDGGSSSGLFGNGRSVTRPGRSISNILVAYSSQQRYQAAMANLMPRPLPVLANLLGEQALAAAPLAGADPIPAGIEYPLNLPAVAQGPLPVDPPPELAVESSLISISRPLVSQTLRGQVPVTILIARHADYSWSSLRINGALAAMSGTRLLQYQWNTALTADGYATLEVTLWTREKTILEQRTFTAEIANGGAVLSLPVLSWN